MLVRALLPCIMFAGLLMAAGPAAAAERYASPSGTGTDCTEEAPCSLPTAISGAVAGDAVFAFADRGDYRLGSGIRASVPVNGFGGTARLIFSSGGLRMASGSAADLYVQSSSDDTAFALDSSAATATRIFARSGSTGHACFLLDGTLTNSVCWAGSAGDYAIELDGSNVLRNVTAVGGTATAILALGRDRCGCAAVVNTLVNVIARSGAGSDLIGESQDGVSMTVNVTHSSYATVLERGDTSRVVINGDSTNQTAPPLFVDPAAGDFRQAPGSPTVDAGVTGVANGETDVDGDPRTIVATDIGADEFLPPFAGVSLANQTVRVRGALTSVRIGCPADAVAPCQGTLALNARVAGKALRLGKGAFAIESGEDALVVIKLSAKALKLLGPGKTLSTTGTADARDGAGTRATSTARIKLKR